MLSRYSYVKRIPKKKSVPKFSILLFIVSLIAISLLITQGKASAQDPKPSPKTSSINLSKIKASKTSGQANTNIQNLLESQVNQFPGDYSVYIKDLKSGAIYTVNSDNTFESASLYKLAVMYKTYDSIQKGELSKSDVLSEDESALDQILDPEDYVDNGPLGAVTYTVSDALNAMITVSDNYAALLLADKLGWQNVNDFLLQQNINGFNLIDTPQPTVTAHATADLLETIYDKKAVNPEASQEMLDLLLGQQVNDRIPAYLPQNVQVAHKTGELDNVRNDAGIVFGKKSNYIFVFLTNTPTPQDAIENIAQLSKTMYNALEQ